VSLEPGFSKEADNSTVFVSRTTVKEKRASDRAEKMGLSADEIIIWGFPSFPASHRINRLPLKRSLVGRNELGEFRQSIDLPEQNAGTASLWLLVTGLRLIQQAVTQSEKGCMNYSGNGHFSWVLAVSFQPSAISKKSYANACIAG